MNHVNLLPTENVSLVFFTAIQTSVGKQELAKSDAIVSIILKNNVFTFYDFLHFSCLYLHLYLSVFVHQFSGGSDVGDRSQQQQQPSTRRWFP